MIQREGITLVPLKAFFNDRGIAKLILGIAKGRKKQDKREAIKNVTGTGRKPVSSRTADDVQPAAVTARSNTSKNIVSVSRRVWVL